MPLWQLGGDQRRKCFLSVMRVLFQLWLRYGCAKINLCLLIFVGEKLLFHLLMGDQSGIMKDVVDAGGAGNHPLLLADAGGSPGQHHPLPFDKLKVSFPYLR